MGKKLWLCFYLIQFKMNFNFGRLIVLLVGLFGICSGLWNFECPLFDPNEDCQIEGDQRFATKYGAELADLNQWPYLVSLQRPFISCFVHFCEGVLIAPNLVLTAAHCVDQYAYTAGRDFPDEEIYVTRSAKCSQQEGQGGRIQPKEIVIHPFWNTLEYRNDAAIIVLREDLSDEYVGYRDARFPQTYSLRQLQDVQIAGYRLSGGPTEDVDTPEYRQNFVVPLLQATLSLIPESQCRSFIGGFYNSKVGAEALSYDVMICAFNSNTDTCKGDSGTPLIYKEEGKKDLVIGIASWGPSSQCSPDEFIEAPAVFARVGQFVDWIDEVYVEKSSGPLPPELQQQQGLILENPTFLDCSKKFLRTCTRSLQKSCCEDLSGVRMYDRCFNRRNEYIYTGVCESSGQVVLESELLGQCKCS
eukprot:TRINITY_DN4809_c0_g5_i2.p1 TRINITY_DN4809_c0_g5~~TRINITY_DN4809_c0_g5_i2.p1  ORF type:complete len:416 (-),score=62.52 TRINITY_DN4809_c0_g5_i2:111-1358(-)